MSSLKLLFRVNVLILKQADQNVYEHVAELVAVKRNLTVQPPTFITQKYEMCQGCHIKYLICPYIIDRNLHIAPTEWVWGSESVAEVQAAGIVMMGTFSVLGKQI